MLQKKLDLSKQNFFCKRSLNICLKDTLKMYISLIEEVLFGFKKSALKRRKSSSPYSSRFPRKQCFLPYSLTSVVKNIHSGRCDPCETEQGNPVCILMFYQLRRIKNLTLGWEWKYRFWNFHIKMEVRISYTENQSWKCRHCFVLGLWRSQRGINTAEWE